LVDTFGVLSSAVFVYPGVISGIAKAIPGYANRNVIGPEIAIFGNLTLIYNLALRPLPSGL